MTSLLISSSLLLLLLIIIYTISSFFRALFAPLAQVPGPIYTLFSSAPITLLDHLDDRTAWTHRLHLRYGPVVRLSPKEISICSSEAINQVYRGSSRTGYYSKGPIYTLFRQYGEDNSFTALDFESHLQRRKAFGSAYLQSTVLGREAQCSSIWQTAKHFVAYVEREGRQSDEGDLGCFCIDLFIACHYYVADCMNHHIFGTSMGALSGDQYSRKSLIDVAYNPGEALTYWLLTLLPLYAFRRRARKIWASLQDRILNRSPSEAVSPLTRREITNVLYRRFTVILENVKANTHDGTLYKTVAHRLAAKVAGSHESRDDYQEDAVFYDRPARGASECADQFIAGLENVTDTLCYVIFCLSKPEATGIQAKLRAEVAGMSLSTLKKPSQDDLLQLLDAPILDAVVKETLRLFPATTVSMHRKVPLGGRTIGGFYIPEGILVGGTTYSANRDETCFHWNGDSSVLEWLPERWINANHSAKAKMNQRLWTFSSGERSCFGQR